MQPQLEDQLETYITVREARIALTDVEIALKLVWTVFICTTNILGQFGLILMIYGN